MKLKKSLISIFLLIAVFLIPIQAEASNVYIKDIDIRNDVIDYNDNLVFDIEFNLPSSNRVYDSKIYFYIDNKLVGGDSRTIRENRNYRYSVDPGYLKEGRHRLKVKVKVWDDEYDEYIGSDTETEYFYVDECTWSYCDSYYRYDYYNDIYFITPSIVDVPVGEDIEFKLGFRTSSNRKHLIRVRFFLDGKIDESYSEYVYDGDIKEFIVHTNNLYPGRHNLKVDVYLYENHRYVGLTTKNIVVDVYGTYRIKHTIDIPVKEYSVSVYTAPTTLEFGQPVNVYGYTSLNGIKTSGVVDLYVNGQYVKTVRSDNAGYYSSYVNMPNEGYNVIEVSFNNNRNSRTVFVKKKEEQDKQTKENGEVIINVSKEDKPISIIIVKDGKIQRVYVDGKTKKENDEGQEDIDFEYIDVSVSTKELTMNQHKGNVLEVSVFNHMNSTKVFSLDSDFGEKWTYVSEPEIIKRGERKMLSIYFKPLTDKRGKFEGNVYVLMNGEPVKTIPIELFIAGHFSDKDYELGFNYNIIYWIAGVLFLIIIVATSFLYFLKAKGRTKYMEPRFPSLDVGHLRMKNKNGEIYTVPEGNVLR